MNRLSTRPNGSTSADAKLMVRLISDESCDKIAVTTCNESRPLDVQIFNVASTGYTCYIAGHSIPLCITNCTIIRSIKKKSAARPKQATTAHSNPSTR